MLKLERWQIFTMLAYFPTEQLYYLRVHDIIPAAITLPVLGRTVTLNTKKLSLASSRFYLAYIFLEFFRLKERAGLLHAKEKALSRTNVNSAEANAEKAELKDSWKAHRLATTYNIFQLPGALHWCVHFSPSSTHIVLCRQFPGCVWYVEPGTPFLNYLRLVWVAWQSQLGCVSTNFKR